MSDPLYFNRPLFTGAVEQRELEGENPLVKYDPTEKSEKRAERATALRRKQVMDGSAFKPGGWKYHEVNKMAVPVKHPSGLFFVYYDKASDAPKSPANSYVENLAHVTKEREIPKEELKVPEPEPLQVQDEKAAKKRGPKKKQDILAEGSV